MAREGRHLDGKPFGWEPREGHLTVFDREEILVGLAREVVTIPHDPAIVDGILQWDSLRPSTHRAWLRAAAAVARGL